MAAAISALVAATACGGGQPAAPPPEPAKPAPKTPEQRIALYQQCWGYFNEKAWDKFAPCYAESATSEQVDATGGTANGRAAIIKAAQDGAAIWPDVKGDLQLVIGHGPHAVAVALWHGTNTGPMPGPDGKSLPATNKPFGFLMAHMAEFDADGQAAVRDASYVDEGTLMSQLGLSKAKARPVATPSGASPIIAIAKNDEAEAKNVAAAQSEFDAFNKHDVKAVDALLTDTYTLHEVARPADLDRKANMATTLELLKGMPDAKITPTTVFGAGDYVVAMGSLSGTNTGGFPSMGVKKNGKAVSLKFLEIFRMENGKIAEDWLFYNGASFAAQLGAM
jgi:predicted ester cyclase